MDSPLNLPNFFIIGASKAGSTSLNYYLDQHPEIRMSDEKEPGFFQNNELYSKGLQWYSSTFFSGPAYPAMGEATASYLYYTLSAERLKQLPRQNQRFIVMLREPVKRTYSQYWHEVRKHESRYFSEALKDEDDLIKSDRHVIFEHPPKSIYLGRSLYFSHIDNYLKHFRREQLLIIFFENLKRNPDHVFNQIFEFLDIGNHPINTDLIHNYGENPLLQLRINKFKNSPIYRKFLRNVVPETIKAKLRNRKIRVISGKMEGTKEAYPKMRLRDQQFLKDFFKEDIQNLKMILTKKETEILPNWIK